MDTQCRTKPAQADTVACLSCDRLFHAKCVERQASEQRRRQAQGKPPLGSGSSKRWLDFHTDADGDDFVCQKVCACGACPCVSPYVRTMWGCCITSVRSWHAENDREREARDRVRDRSVQCSGKMLFTCVPRISSCVVQQQRTRFHAGLYVYSSDYYANAFLWCWLSSVMFSHVVNLDSTTASRPLPFAYFDLVLLVSFRFILHAPSFSSSSPTVRG